MRSDFCVFVLSHGRAGRVKTLDALKKCGYTGEWRVVIDDEDTQGDEYRRLYGNRVCVFSKEAVAQTFDQFDLDRDRRSVVYARNACFKIAMDEGFRYFLELDDDYTDFQHRWDDGAVLKVRSVDRLDEVCEAFIDFLSASGAVTVAMAQGGDFIGGRDNQRVRQRVMRKAMNTFFCDVERPLTFVGRINEDVNTYCVEGMRGKVFLSVCDLMVTQERTQASKGGMTELYLGAGTYVKSFFSVMCCPSFVTVSMMGDKHMRAHHRVDWRRGVPKIISGKYQKKD